jgi:DNA-binding NtrC family response regulator
MNFGPRAETGKVPPHTATVVLVGFAKQDQDYLQELLNCSDCPIAADWSWAIESRDSAPAALAALHRGSIPVVVCDRDRTPEAWKDLLAQFAFLAQPPCLIVTSRLADEHLWAEALNLGAYDVLARPFDRAEVVRSISLARFHWCNRASSQPEVARAVA